MEYPKKYHEFLDSIIEFSKGFEDGIEIIAQNDYMERLEN